MQVPSWWDGAPVGEMFYRYYWTLWKEGGRASVIVPPAYEGLLWLYWQRYMIPISSLTGTPGQALVVRMVHPDHGVTFEAKGSLKVFCPLPSWQVQILRWWGAGRRARAHPATQAAYFLSRRLYTRGGRDGVLQDAAGRTGWELNVALPRPWDGQGGCPVGSAALRMARQLLSAGARMVAYHYLETHGVGRTQIRAFGKAYGVKLSDYERDLVLGSYRDFSRSLRKYKQQYQSAKEIAWPIGYQTSSTVRGRSTYRPSSLILPR